MSEFDSQGSFHPRSSITDSVYIRGPHINKDQAVSEDPLINLYHIEHRGNVWFAAFLKRPYALTLDIYLGLL